MRKKNGWFGIAIAGVLFFAVQSPVSAGEIDWDGGRWRLELSGFSGLHQGRADRSGDFNLNGTVEYEVDLWQRTTLGLRFHPLFVYEEHGTDETILGLGMGPIFRLYLRKEERNGFFAEFGVSALWHSREFESNSTQGNFIAELGVGYEFENRWHVAAKWRHMSNAGLGNRNAGVNGVGIGVGYTF